MSAEKFRKQATCPYSGQEFTIRRLRLREFMTEIGVLPIFMSQAADKAMEDFREKILTEPGLEEKIVRFCLSRGVVKPKIWLGADEECPDGQIAFDDLGSDADSLSAQVLEFSFRMAGLKDVEKFFRGGEPGNSGPPGAEVRTEAVESPPDAPEE